jgi:hypothetical protein
VKIEGIKMGDDHSKEGKVALVGIVEMVKGPKKMCYLMFLNKK